MYETELNDVVFVIPLLNKLSLTFIPSSEIDVDNCVNSLVFFTKTP
jgi:hypothetical protein